MLTLKDIHMLASRPERRENSVLTLYLDINQSNQANLNRGFENQLKDMLAGIKTSINNPDELSSFETACHQMERVVQQYQVAAHGLAAVFDVFDGFVWTEQLNVPLTNRLQWSRAVWIEPLIAAIDEYERIGIVLLDRQHLRVLTLCLGEVQEQIHEVFDQRRVRHTKTVGMNNLSAASHAQQKADENVRLNLREMIKRIESVVEQQRIGRLILAGSSEITASLRALLPKRLASRVIGTVNVVINANLKELRSAAAPIAERFERESEEAIVAELVTSAAKGGRGVVGLAHTLHAVNQGRTWQLFYADGFHSPGYECAECAALFSAEPVSCSLCGSSVRSIVNVVDRAVAHALRKGTKVEIIRDESAESALRNVGGIGAFLRTRTTSLRAS
jgi:peptide subunit release factor 1 (eRF1)